MKKAKLIIMLAASVVLLASASLAAPWGSPGYYPYGASTSNRDAQGYVDPGKAYWKVLAKAQPDECFYGVGNVSNQYPIKDICSGTFKRNNGYIWGMTTFGDKIFFGTGANVACLVIENYLQYESAIVDPDYVCEMDKSAYSYHDFRTSSIYMYSKSTGLQNLQLPPLNAQLLRLVTGIRSGGATSSGIVFLAGPIAHQRGIVIFAFNGRTGGFLGSTTLTIGSNIRKFLTTSSGELYVGIGGTEDADGTGSVYKWMGNSTDILRGRRKTLFAFEKVGENLDGEAAELCEHDGRIFIATWPNTNDPNNYAGLWMSPPLPLTANSISGWQKVWSADKYEPYPLAAKLYGGGPLASFGGYLYWGTMHVPGMTYYYYTNGGEDQPMDQNGRIELIANLNRSFSVFRGSNFSASNPNIQLLYGGYNGGYFKVPYRGSFYDQKNLMGLTPLYGEGGINNLYNNYCWSMTVFNNHLYLGTMDNSPLSQYYLLMYPPYATFGFDLFRFDSTSSSAKKISDTGMGNVNQYGIRTMVVGGDTLYIGTAGNSNIQPGGGWELIGLKETELNDSFVYSGPFRMEAEKMSLNNFYVTDDDSASEDRVIYNRSNTCGTTFTHTGEVGSCDIAIRYYDPGLGSSQSMMRFYISGQLVAQNALNQSRGWHTWHINDVVVQEGNVMNINTTLDWYDYRYPFRIDYIDFVVPDGSALPPIVLPSK